MTPQNKSNPSILSFIIDGMDQAKCQIPYKGTQDCFSDPFKQVITGVKEHGHGVTLFPTIDTVSKGANLTFTGKLIIGKLSGSGLRFNSDKFIRIYRIENCY
jgi:hypothetical protein